jgi:hypothetical protein
MSWTHDSALRFFVVSFACMLYLKATALRLRPLEEKKVHFPPSGAKALLTAVRLL